MSQSTIKFELKSGLVSLLVLLLSFGVQAQDETLDENPAEAPDKLSGRYLVWNILQRPFPMKPLAWRHC